MIEGKTHKERLLNYLIEYGSITSLESIRDLGNTRLSATIFQLREEGHCIPTEMTSVATRWVDQDGNRKKTSVAKYTLIRENVQLEIPI
jgi:hypothetical protein|tara:strand:+ start:1451 stop:1717 length:267 start_codon:yes stop_codon:yes gene_type:complete